MPYSNMEALLNAHSLFTHTLCIGSGGTDHIFYNLDFGFGHIPTLWLFCKSIKCLSHQFDMVC